MTRGLGIVRSLDELQQMCSAPSDGWTQGEWCWAANDAVKMATALLAELETISTRFDELLNGQWAEGYSNAEIERLAEFRETVLIPVGLAASRVTCRGSQP